MRSLSRELGEGVGVLAYRLNLSVRELSAGDRDHPQAVCHHLMDPCVRRPTSPTVRVSVGTILAASIRHTRGELVWAHTGPDEGYLPCP